MKTVDLENVGAVKSSEIIVSDQFDCAEVGIEGALDAQEEFSGPPAPLTALEVAHFWGKVRVGQAFECWEWTGRANAKGYGRSHGTQAHRVAYELVHGPIPDGLIVRHDCDNPPCCNPGHLLAGTHLDNSRDAKERDRLAYGAKSGKVKLTDAQVREIWSNPDRLTGAQLAARFGVASSTISYVRNGGRRQRVTGPIIGAGC